MKPDEVSAIGVVLAALASGGLGLWGAANLRSNVFRRWRGRVAAASAGLATDALHILDEIQMEITALRGSRASAWQPNDFTADPASLVTLVDRFQRVMSARAKIDAQFGRLLLLGPLLVWTAAAYLVSVITWGTALLGTMDSTALLRVGLATMAATLAVSGISLGQYAVLIHRIGGAEILHDKISRRNDGQGPADVDES